MASFDKVLHDMLPGRAGAACVSRAFATSSRAAAAVLGEHRLAHGEGVPDRRGRQRLCHRRPVLPRLLHRAQQLLVEGHLVDQAVAVNCRRTSICGIVEKKRRYENVTLGS